MLKRLIHAIRVYRGRGAASYDVRMWADWVLRGRM